MHITSYIPPMKINYLSFALFCTAALLCHCKNTEYTPANLPNEYLRFGDGGGFAGIETTYTLLENGQLFKHKSKGTDTLELSSCKRSIAKKLFEKAESLGLKQLEFMYPSNIYSFIEIVDDGKTNRIAWGDREHPVDEKISAFYDELRKLTFEK